MKYILAYSVLTICLLIILAGCDYNSAVDDKSNYMVDMKAGTKEIYNSKIYSVYKYLLEEENSGSINNYNEQFAVNDIDYIMNDLSNPRKIVNNIDHYYFGEISREAIFKSNGFYISQHYEKFKNISYSGGTMSEYGCGPIALSIALNMKADKYLYDAVEIAEWAKVNGYTDSYRGTKWSMIDAYTQAHNIPVRGADINTIEDMKEIFDKGKIIVTTMGKGHFTDDGHFVVLVGLNELNQVNVLDSASIYRTNVSWNPETIIKESKGVYWIID